MQSIVGLRIKNARLQHGYTLQKVADKLNVSKQMVNKYEQGTMPGSDKLIALAKLFETKVDYFFRTPEVALGEINFRKKSKFKGRKINALKEEIRVRTENYLYVENLFNLNTTFKNPVGKVVLSSRHDVVKAVNLIRKEWNIGNDPIHNVVELLEDHEVKVIEVNEDTLQFDGLATVIDGKYYVVVINKNMPIERKRFTLLHELGHLLLDITDKTDKDQEKYCNWFASEMLLSTENIKMEFGAKRNSITLEELKNVQTKYGISIKAIVYKLSDAEIISSQKVPAFYQQVNAKAQLKAEVDASRYGGNETSIRYENLVYRSLSEETITMSKASALLHTSLDKLRENMSSVTMG
jgi:Zn-dependent peptidase ImmA (M78 family)